MNHDYLNLMERSEIPSVKIGNAAQIRTEDLQR
jgi:hypothetical protein